jgi:hypoxanthine-DNA glycosylase
MREPLAPAAAPGAARPGRLQGLPPVLARHTRCIVLGSFPGAASLALQQYYGHPRNHFWPLLAAIWEVDLVAWPYRRRLAEVRRRGLGIWDAYASCRREGSLDAAIEEAQLNDFEGLARRAPGLRLVLHNGTESTRAARALQALGWPTRRLPSTSPANASWSFERKLAAWRAAFLEGGVA